MSRPLRLQFPGALYHVTSRGDRKAAIYLDNSDRLVWLSILQEVCFRYNFVVHAYCLMNNHYHIVLETPEGNLTQGMQQLNGLFSQYFNRHHNLSGHVFQGRFKGILVQREAYLLELARYVVLNPVRAKLASRPEEWQWSSYPCVIGTQTAPTWLDSDSTLSRFGTEPLAAQEAYRKFVYAGIGEASPLLKIKHQLILGDDEFIHRIEHSSEHQHDRAIIRAQRRAVAQSLEYYAKQYQPVEEAMAMAYHSTAYTMEEIGRHFGVSSKTVSRAIKKHKPG
ncbi:MAG TPA: transposase [Duganella sp.]|nr:transposase [Duganella sp.]